MNFLLTTTNNPYNKVALKSDSGFSNWFNWDEEQKICTCGLLARFAHISDDLSDSDNDREILDAAKHICNFSFPIFDKFGNAVTFIILDEEGNLLPMNEE